MIYLLLSLHENYSKCPSVGFDFTLKICSDIAKQSQIYQMALITKLSQHEQLYLIKTAPHTLRRQMIKCCVFIARHQTARR